MIAHRRSDVSRPLFDVYMMVDWSAKNRPHPEAEKADAVWVGEFAPTASVAEETYHRSRPSAFEYIENRLRQYINSQRRVLVGFDFPYAYPYGLADALGIADPSNAWWRIWETISDRMVDTTDNGNNRFDVAADINRIIGTRRNGTGPFWGCPKGAERRWLAPTSPGFPFPVKNGLRLERLRMTESRLSGTQAAWKLYGIGSAGGQALTGIPYLHRLRSHPEFGGISRVWPFETGFTTDWNAEAGPIIVHAEAWPGIVADEVAGFQARYPDAIKDRIQVRALCRRVATLDQGHELVHWFEAPDSLSEVERKRCVEHEGWVLGAG